MTLNDIINNSSMLKTLPILWFPDYAHKSTAHAHTECSHFAHIEQIFVCKLYKEWEKHSLRLLLHSMWSGRVPQSCWNCKNYTDVTAPTISSIMFLVVSSIGLVCASLPLIKFEYFFSKYVLSRWSHPFIIFFGWARDVANSLCHCIILRSSCAKDHISRRIVHCSHAVILGRITFCEMLPRVYSSQLCSTELLFPVWNIQ